MALFIIWLLIAGSIGLMMWGTRRNPSNRAIQQRVYNELADERDRPRRGWLRALAPLVRMNQRIGFGRSRSEIFEDNIVVGKFTITKGELFVLKECCVVIVLLVYLFWVEFQFSPFWLVVWGMVGFLLPDVWMRQQIASRRHSISGDLPEVVELLTLCVDAGADFMGALQRVVREYRRCPLRSELALVLQEVSVGKRRREAFRALAERVKVPEVSAFSRTIVHADRMGTGMASALRIMAEDSRMRRYHQAERFAQKAPLKMLIPLIFIMFSVLMIVAGPVLLQFMKGDLFPQL